MWVSHLMMVSPQMEIHQQAVHSPSSHQRCSLRWTSTWTYQLHFVCCTWLLGLRQGMESEGGPSCVGPSLPANLLQEEWQQQQLDLQEMRWTNMRWQAIRYKQK